MVRWMNLIERVAAAADRALEDLRRRAADEQWDLSRIEQEKSLFQLSVEVTLCCTPGCLNMVHAIPGFFDLHCKEHEPGTRA